MRATAEPQEGNRVRLSIVVDEDEIDKVLDEAIRTLTRQVRVPGFRPGKVPRQVLEARMGGAAALRAEALREAIPDFYRRAVIEAEVDPIANPEIDITSGEDAGGLSFDALVEVRPTVGIPGYGGLRVTVPSPEVGDDEVDTRVDRLRDTDAELVEVDRPVLAGDHVTLDIRGSAPDGREVANVDDYLYEVGSGRVVPELDAKLVGVSAGGTVEFDTEPEEGHDPLSFHVVVKEVKEKVLPELTDEWVAESSEYETVEALRAGLAERIGEIKLLQARMALREGAVAGLAELVDDDEIPAALVDEEVSERVHDLNHRLGNQKLTIEQFLAGTGRTADELLAQIRGEAHRSVKADLALRALADAEGIEVSDEEFDDEVAAMATRMKTTPKKLRDQIERNGRTLAVRSEQRKAKALDWLLGHVEVVDEDGNPVTTELLSATGKDDDAAEDTAAVEEEGAPA